MKIEITSKYLVFPVNSLAAVKRLSFYNADKTVYELEISIDSFNPDFYAYIDVSRFIGQTLDLSVCPEMRLEFREADKMDIADSVCDRNLPRLVMRADIDADVEMIEINSLKSIW